MTSRLSGVTLLELMVAIAIGTMVFLTLHALVTGISDSTGRSRQAISEWEQRELSELRLRRLVLNAHAGGQPLRGDARQVDFATLCADNLALPRRCRAGLRIDQRDRGGRVTLTLDGHAALGLPIDGVGVRYLRSAANGGVWDDRWTDSELPLAIGIIASTDTLVLPVAGAR